MTKREIAMNYFKEGYNCAQAVALAYAEEAGMDKDTLARIATSFGGGMGRMREVCGAFSGMMIINGIKNGTTLGSDAEGKKANYELVQKMAADFKEEMGSIICRDLLYPGGNPHMAPEGPTPEPRTDEYLKKRPCLEIVGTACDILDKYI